MSEGRDFLYEPMQASWIAVVLYAGSLAACALLAPEPVWPFLTRGGSFLHVCFWILVVMSPVMAISVGWTYALTPHHFVVRRFGRDHLQLPLSEFQGTKVIAGMVWLQFTSRRVFLVSGVDQSRQDFLAALESRARVASGKSSAPVVEQTGDGSVRLAVAQLKFPDACVTCGQAPVGTTKLEAFRWIGIPLLATMKSWVKVEAPVCAAHRQNDRLLRFFASCAVLGLGVATVWTYALLRDDSYSAVGVTLLGAMLGLVLLRVAELFRLRAWVSWRALGIRASDVSGDLLHVTIHTRSEALLRALLKLQG